MYAGSEVVRRDSDSPVTKKNQNFKTTIANAVAVGLRRYLEELNLDATSILNTAGLKHETFSERYSRFPVQQLAMALEISARHGNKPFFGLHFGEWYSPAFLHACNYAISSAPDLRSALHILQDHRNLVAEMPTQLSDQGAYAELSWDIDIPSSSPSQVIDFKAMRTLKHIQQAVGAQWKPLRVNLVYEKPENVSEHYRLLGQNIHFDQPVNSFWIGADAMAATMPGANPDIYHMALNSFRNPFPCKQDDTNPVDRLRRFISERLDKSGVTLAAASKHLDMNPQQLRRVLNKHDTCFQCVLDDTRKTHAAHYLCETDIRFSEIAFLLGLSDQSALSRAVKRWFGMPPKDMRRSYVR